MTSPAPRDVWELLTERDPDALVSQTPEWTSCMGDFGFEDVSRLYEMSSGERFVLPMLRRSPLRLDQLAVDASMPPAWGMGGLLCERAPRIEEIHAIIEDLRSGAVARTSIRPNPLHADRWAPATEHGATAIPRLAHVLELDGGPAQLWPRLTKSARQGIRKAERMGVEVECDTTGRLVPAYFDLFSMSVERWARKQHEPLWLARWRARRRDTQAKFERLAARLGESMRIWLARKDGVPLAAMVVLIGPNASDTRGAMNRELAAPVNANDLLQWHAIDDAYQQGCRQYHFGESGTSLTLAHFKEKFGARPVAYAEYRLERVPLSALDAILRGMVKRAVGFRDS